MDLGLKDVPIAVAGASRGLGYAVACELAREGARVAVCSREWDGITEAAESISRETGSEVHPLVADVSDQGQAHRFIEEAVLALGGLQVLITNSGGPAPGPPTDFAAHDWESALKLNFLSAVTMVEAALSHIQRAAWGRILMMTSFVAKEPAVNLSLSGAARAATSAFAKALSVELAPRSITVNTIMPGTILTDRIRFLAKAPASAGPDHPAFSATIKSIPAGRLGTPSEFAAAAAFLCSERASYITGASLQVDGGMVRSLF